MSAESFPEPTTNPESLERVWLDGETRQATGTILEERAEALEKQLKEMPLWKSAREKQALETATNKTKAMLDVVNGDGAVSLGDVLPTVKIEVERRVDLVRKEQAAYAEFFHRNFQALERSNAFDPRGDALERESQLKKSREGVLEDLRTDLENAKNLDSKISKQLANTE